MAVQHFLQAIKIARRPRQDGLAGQVPLQVVGQRDGRVVAPPRVLVEAFQANHFQVTINEGGVAGKNVYDYGKDFQGRPYDPNPHVIYVGAPIGRSGSDAASVEQTVYRQIWVSANPRPAFVNK